MPFQETSKVCPVCGEGGHFKKLEGFHLFGQGQFKCDACNSTFAFPKEVKNLTEQTARTSETTHKSGRGFLSGMLAPEPHRRGRGKKNIRLF